MENLHFIALEEHYSYPPVSRSNPVLEVFKQTGHPAYERLGDLSSGRLAQMDKAGIRYQILSLLDPGVQELDNSTGEATRLAREANDALAAAIKPHPDRFGAFATLATQDPASAAAEMKRAVQELGFKGALINGHARGKYLDDKESWVLFEAAEALDVPIYLHPTTPHPDVMKAYFEKYEAEGMHLASWGFAVETGTHALRLIYSGLFDAFPRLKIILGHMGEMLPFAMYRVDRYYLPGAWYVSEEQKKANMSRPGAPKKMPSEYLRRNFFITTSGNFSQAALDCALATMGADRILFSVDYPMDDNQAGVDFLKAAALSEEDRRKIASGNAERLFGITARP